MQLFVSTALGLEPLLEKELNALGCAQVRPSRAGCKIDVDLQQAYVVCLWSRIASRVLLPLADLPAESGDHLYQAALSLDWQKVLLPGVDIAIDFSGTNAQVRHTGFGALRIKDGLADWCRQAGRDVPRLTGDASVRISARLRKGRLEIALDFSGDAMHKRGYRQQSGPAPLRESLAAALLYYAGWPEEAEQGGQLFDPMCGSGTLLIEAAWMALDRAPGLGRQTWGFQAWPGHDQALWQEVSRQAAEREQAGRKAWNGRIKGADIDPRAIAAARANISAAGLEGLVEVKQAAITDVRAPAEAGLLITNPPYGERLNDKGQALAIYRSLGDKLRRDFCGWKAAVLAPEAEQGQALGIHSYRSLSFYNGALACKLYLMRVEENEFLSTSKEVEPSEGARMVANRISKNLARSKSWRKQSAVRAWRCYDRDLSEYAAAVDIYEAQAETYALVQEYAAPKSVDAALARHRFNEIVTGVGLATGIKPENLLTRRRERQRGASQYEKSAEAESRECIVTEGQARFLVNLTDYLDTGLFLDHRPVRRYLHKNIGRGRFLNLFCYTATVSVQAALGGASESLSLDMSNTYLDWARRNFALNRIDTDKHRLERVNCLEWLRETRDDRGYDMILLDPPSFSNSKRMDEVLDIERDHPELIRNSMKLLKPDGTLIFSTNKRGFNLHPDIASGYAVEDFSRASIDPDFERHPNIHQCWLIHHG